jgi:hypothetical protein
MPIVVAFIALGLLIYGAWWSFVTIEAHFSLAAAIAASIVVIAIIAAAFMRWLASRREIAPNVPKGQNGAWTHELQRDWGGIRIASEKRLCDVRVSNESGSYIFADLRGARAQEANNTWQVVLTVKDAKHADWTLPMQDRSEAHKWARILSLATQEKL